MLADVVLVMFSFILYHVDHTFPASFNTSADWETENLLHLCSVSGSGTGWVLRVLEHRTIGCDSLKSVLL